MAASVNLKFGMILSFVDGSGINKYSFAQKPKIPTCGGPKICRELWFAGLGLFAQFLALPVFIGESLPRQHSEI